MSKMDKETYSDKVFGCWLGKCVCGSIGAPLEGRKELFDYEFKDEYLKIVLPNDDLELQVLWLDAMEKLGPDIDSDDLAKAFCETVKYNPGEYAYFKRNWRRGIHPPLSGVYNNRYYSQGMGCAIRAEIWACLAAGDPALAAKLCVKDACLDHSAESIYSEQFTAAAEAQAFVDSDLNGVIEAGLAQIPADSAFARMARDVMGWCDGTADWKLVRERIIRRYGHPDCTNMLENMGITLMALLLGGGDLKKTVMIALNSGYDTDCTCGIAGAFLGIFAGAKRLKELYGVQDTGYVMGIPLARHSLKIEDLAKDVASYALLHGGYFKRSLEIEGSSKEIRREARKPLVFAVNYNGQPAMRPGERREMSLVTKNCDSRELEGVVKLNAPSGFSVDPSRFALNLKPAEAAEFKFSVAFEEGLCSVSDRNIFKVEVSCGGSSFEHEFGIVGAAPWRLYGPFISNVVEYPSLPLEGDHYGRHTPLSCYGNDSSTTRNYQLSSKAEFKLAHLDEGALAAGRPVRDESEIVWAYDDMIPVDASLGYVGPCVVYLVSEFDVQEGLEASLSIGRSGPVKAWLNGEPLCEQDGEAWWHPESVNLPSRKLRREGNRLVVKAARQSETLRLSVNFKGIPGEWNAHRTDFVFKAPKG